MVKHDFLFSFGVCSSKGASQEECEIHENKSSVWKANKSQPKERKFFSKVQTKEFAWVVCSNDMDPTENKPSTSGDFKTTDFCLRFLFSGGKGDGGGGGGEGIPLKVAV